MKDCSRFVWSGENINDFASAKIAGSFWIENRQYLVIAIEHELDGFVQLEQSQIGRFEAEGQHYVIVEADSRSLPAPSDAVSRLTARELQIVRYVALGHPNKQIAKQLHISEWTVSTHLRRIFAKLGVDSRAAMVYQCASLIDR